MSPAEATLLGLYFLTLAILAVFGLHRYAVVYLYLRHSRSRARPAPPPAVPPRVTVQLPIFNELYVVERLLESVTRIRHPRERLEIQVLDDSTDETAAIARAAVERYRRLGFDIRYRHRSHRRGFKAGALAEGLAEATGEFVLILDADFVAPRDILEKSLGHFADPGVGMVQARWDHINRSYSLLTEVQSILLDGHFVLEHGGRSRSGRFFNFNGTAGVWRRTAIEDAGGWQGDTLTEDLDLSYRAQLRGWRFVFLQDLVAPAEVPVEMNAFKGQQRRWAKGSAQTCLKLLPRILAAPLPLPVKVEAAFHLSGNFCYPLMLLLSLLMLPALVIRGESGLYGLLLIDVPLFLGATASVCSFYLVAQREVAPASWRRRIRFLPAVLAVGVGLAVSNSKAVIEALAGRQTEFERTPKHRVESVSDGWRHKRYRGRIGLVPLGELLLAGYFTAAVWYAAANGLFGSLPFVLLFQLGFLYTAALSLLQGAARAAAPAPSPALEA